MERRHFKDSEAGHEMQWRFVLASLGYTVIQRQIELQLAKCTKMMGNFVLSGAGDCFVRPILSILEMS
jgi:hypothetical protein